jgi:hypothetical protein
MGITINTDKWKVWGPAPLPLDISALQDVPRVPWSPGSGLRVLGLPVEHPSSTSFRQQQLQQVVSHLQDACSLLGHLGDPQVLHLLLRYCLDACRVMHMLRGMDCTALLPELGTASACVRSCLGDALGCRKLSETEWAQCTLPLRFGGLGIKDPVTLLPIARLAAGLCYLERGRSLCFPEDILHMPTDWKVHVRELHRTLGTNFQPVATWLPLEAPQSIDGEHRSQKWWSNHLHKARARNLLHSLPLREACRFTLQRMPSTTAWMEVTPSAALGTTFTGSEYRLLLQ